MKKFLYEIFSLFSRLLHVIAGGDADLTLSARSHYSGWWIEKWIDALFRLVLKQHNHCRNAWELEKMRSLKRIDDYIQRGPHDRTPKTSVHSSRISSIFDPEDINTT